jgi:(1->4)-alpha-D-glucan 1-alpha-D-glucosylmutase
MPPVVPLATYRLQLTKDFGFDAAAQLAPYLKQLGITHVYASPFLKARPGSTHGYDIVDHERLNPELGGEDGFVRFSDTLKEHGLGLILDFVPNHMGVGHADNAWWLDVLEWGPKSPHAQSFDIDWEGLPHRRHPGVLLPILGRPYGEALQAGEIELKYDPANGSFAAWYFEHKLPINPQRYSEMLRIIVTAARAEDKPAGHALIALAHDYRDPTRPDYDGVPELKQRLASIDGAAEVIARGLSAYRADNEAGAAALHRLLERQNYRVAYWRVAFSAVNYRRFFDINDLAGIRVERPATFRAVHALVARLIAEDRLQGLRLDHIDGLRDPAQYTRRLQLLVRKLRRDHGLPPDFYIIVEKILGEGEDMPALPGIAGTTGYEWLNTISRVLVDGKGLAPLERTWREATGERTEFTGMLETAKERVIDSMLAAEFTVLTRALSRIAAGHFSTRDFTLSRLRAALQLYVIEFPVYRTYATAAGASARDREVIEAAIERARRRWRAPDPNIFDFLRDAITLDLASNPGYSAPRVRNFAMKLQQFTGPLMAKSLEDTAFYRYHRLLALNEVGGEPDISALPLEQFHRIMQRRADSESAALTATASHDTKRGEDARARILALSEIPQDWAEAVRDWMQLNAPLARGDDGHRRLSRNHEYMVYQALVGAWPERIDQSFVQRMQAYALKAAREGKQETSWTNPNVEYEQALQGFIGAILDPAQSAAFIESFARFAERTALIGALNGLSQLALKCLLPGVPDFYQGTEFWDLSLVDPDNRRPVNFAVRAQALAGLSSNYTELGKNWRDGRVKLALMHDLLALRIRYSVLFQNGSYRPVPVTGGHAEHVIAFAREWRDDRIVIAIGRNFAPLTADGRHWPSGWSGALTLEPREYYHPLVGAACPITSTDSRLDALFRTLPVAVMVRGNTRR